MSYQIFLVGVNFQFLGRLGREGFTSLQKVCPVMLRIPGDSNMPEISMIRGKASSCTSHEDIKTQQQFVSPVAVLNEAGKSNLN